MNDIQQSARSVKIRKEALTVKKRKKGILVWFLVACMILTQTIFTGIVSAADAQNRLSGSNRYKTAVAISQNGWNVSQYAVLARGNDFADALCAGPLAKKYNAPILLTQTEDLNADALAELKRLGVKDVFIIGGTGAVSSKVESVLTSAGIKYERIFGANRYQTSVKVAEKLDNVSSIVLATGLNFPDALSISPVAANMGMPILLSEKDSLPASVMAYLAGKQIVQSYVIGGTGVLSDTVKNTVPNPIRIGGNDRFETNTLVMKQFETRLNFMDLYVAIGEGPSGDEFADALTGAVLAANTASPVILTGKTLPNITGNYIKSKVASGSKVTALGGEAVVPSAVLDSINAYIAAVPVVVPPVFSGGGGGDDGSGGSNTPTPTPEPTPTPTPTPTPEPTPTPTPTLNVASVIIINATTVEITMAELTGAAFTWNGTAVSSSNIAYNSGKYTLTVPSITPDANNTLVISKSGYESYTNNAVVWTNAVNAATEQELRDALAGNAATINVTANIALNSKLAITRPVTIKGVSGGTQITKSAAAWTDPDPVSIIDAILVSVEGVTGKVVLENLIVSGAQRIDADDRGSGILVYNSSDVTLNNITSKNNQRTGLHVYNSTVAANNFSSSGNVTCGVIVDKDMNDPSKSASLTLTGTSAIDDAIQIYSEAGGSEAGRVTVNAAGYVQYPIDGIQIGWTNKAVTVPPSSLVSGAAIAGWSDTAGDESLDTSVSLNFDVLDIKAITSIKFELYNGTTKMGDAVSTGDDLAALLSGLSTTGIQTLNCAFKNRTAPEDNGSWAFSAFPSSSTAVGQPTELRVTVNTGNIVYTTTSNTTSPAGSL